MNERERQLDLIKNKKSFLLKLKEMFEELSKERLKEILQLMDETKIWVQGFIQALTDLCLPEVKTQS